MWGAAVVRNTAVCICAKFHFHFCQSAFTFIYFISTLQCLCFLWEHFSSFSWDCFQSRWILSVCSWCSCSFFSELVTLRNILAFPSAQLNFQFCIHFILLCPMMVSTIGSCSLALVPNTGCPKLGFPTQFNPIGTGTKICSTNICSTIKLLKVHLTQLSRRIWKSAGHGAGVMVGVFPAKKRLGASVGEKQRTWFPLSQLSTNNWHRAQLLKVKTRLLFDLTHSITKIYWISQHTYKNNDQNLLNRSLQRCQMWHDWWKVYWRQMHL